MSSYSPLCVTCPPTMGPAHHGAGAMHAVSVEWFLHCENVITSFTVNTFKMYVCTITSPSPPVLADYRRTELCLLNCHHFTPKQLHLLEAPPTLPPISSLACILNQDSNHFTVSFCLHLISSLSLQSDISVTTSDMPASPTHHHTHLPLAIGRFLHILCHFVHFIPTPSVSTAYTGRILSCIMLLYLHMLLYVVVVVVVVLKLWYIKLHSLDKDLLL